MQLQQLLKCKSLEAIDDRLKHLPPSLNATYDEIYLEIEEQNKYDRKLADRAIMWVMCSYEPLGVDALLDAIRIETDETMSWPTSRISELALMSACNNLLVVDLERRVWTFSHLSVVEYFEGQPMQSGRPNRQRADEYVAKACLLFLNDIYGDRGESRCIAKASVGIDDYNEEEEEEEEEAFPADFDPRRQLQNYVRYYWPIHVRSQEEQGGGTPTGDSPTARLLKPFLGSPGESSVQYRRCLDNMSTGFQSLSPFNPQILKDLQPTSQSVFGMARLGFYFLLLDWWDNSKVDASATNGDDYNLLALAAMVGSEPICRYVVDMGVKVDSAVGPDTGFGSALAAAAFFGHLKVVEFLVKTARANVDLALERGRYGSALATASALNHLDVVEYLVGEGATVDLVLQHGCYGSALAAAAHSGQLKTVKLLVKAKADVNLLLRHGPHGSALAAAADGANLEVVKFLVKKRADVNMVLVCGQHGSALAAAAAHWGGIEIVKFLVEAGANVNQVLESGNYGSAIFAARITRNLSMDYDSFWYLIQQGAEVSQILRSGIPAEVLAVAICDDDRELLDVLTRDGKDVNTIVQLGILGPPLRRAVTSGYHEAVEALVRAGANVNALEPGGYEGSALALVALCDDLDMAELLVRLGADANLVLKSGEYGSAIAAAACEGNRRMVEFLIEHADADVNLLPRAGVFGTALTMAAYAGRYECVEALLAAGAKIDHYVEGGAFRSALEAATLADALEGRDDAWSNTEDREDDELRLDREKVAALLQRHGATA